MRPQTQETIAGRRATGTACSQIPQKNRKLENILFREFGISGKRNVLGIAVLFLLESLGELENKTRSENV